MVTRFTATDDTKIRLLQDLQAQNYSKFYLFVYQTCDNFTVMTMTMNDSSFFQDVCKLETRTSYFNDII